MDFVGIRVLPRLFLTELKDGTYLRQLYHQLRLCAGIRDPEVKT